MNEPLTANELFKVIRKFFNEVETDECVLAWNVLTALRGPDLPSSMALKHATTAVIRQALLGWNGGNEIPADMRDDCEEFRDYRMDKIHGHFGSHAEAAFLVLGLDWGNPNVVPHDGVPL